MSEEKPKKVEIVVDNKATEELVKILKEKEEKEKDPERFQKHFDLADKKLELYKEFGDHRFLDCNSEQECKDLTTALIKDAQKAKKGVAAGSPLVDAQLGIKNDLFTRRFFDSQQMVSELRRLSHEGTPQERADAEHYLNELWKKYVLDKRANPTRSEPSQNPNTPESLLELGLKQKDGFLTPANPEDGDAQRLQRAWRLQRKNRMEGKAE